MTEREADDRIARGGALVAMAVVTVATFGWNLIVPAGPRLPMAILGAVFLVVSTVGWAWAEARGRAMIAAWLCILVAIAFAALAFSSLAVMLISMPLVGLAVVYGSIRWGIAVTALFLFFAAGVRVVQGAPLVVIYTSSTGIIPGAVFVIVLGQLLVRERAARRQLRTYAVQVEELATTRERNRIARDIHDSVGHYLTVVHVQLAAARAVVETDVSAAAVCIERAQDLSREGLAELRQSVSLLRSGGVEGRPFGAAMEALIDESRRGDLEVELRVSGAARPLPPTIEFTLYRGLQEALTNVARHACAHTVTCDLRYEDSTVSLRVADDGVGASSTDGGFGLVGLRERIEIVGGQLRVETSAGAGFVIEIQVPT